MGGNQCRTPLPLHACSPFFGGGAAGALRPLWARHLQAPPGPSSTTASRRGRRAAAASPPKKGLQAGRALAGAPPGGGPMAEPWVWGGRRWGCEGGRGSPAPHRQEKEGPAGREAGRGSFPARPASRTGGPAGCTSEEATQIRAVFGGRARTYPKDPATGGENRQRGHVPSRASHRPPRPLGHTEPTLTFWFLT